MNAFKSTVPVVAAAWIVALLASTASAQVLISDFDTINPITGLRTPGGDSSWVGDVTTQAGHQTVGLTTAIQLGAGLATFGAIDLGANNLIALTASRVNGDSSGTFNVILLSTGGLGTEWSFTPSAFPSVTSLNSADPGNFGTVAMDISAGVPVGNGAADLHAITGVLMTGDGSAGVFEARFDNLAAVPEPAFYAFATGFCLVGFAAYRRFASKTAV